MSPKTSRNDLENELDQVNKVLDSYELKVVEIAGMKMESPVSIDDHWMKTKFRRDEILDALRKMDAAEQEAQQIEDRAALIRLIGRPNAIKIDGAPATLCAVYSTRADVTIDKKNQSVLISAISLPKPGLWAKSEKLADGTITVKPTNGRV